MILCVDKSLKVNTEITMPLPNIDYNGKECTITMMEFRKQPGEVADKVSHGITVIHPDGTITSRIPLTFRLNLGEGGY